MLITKQLAILSTIAIAILAFCPTMNAQVLPFNPGAEALGQSQFTTNTFGADFDPSAIDYDMQPFAPLDVSDFGGTSKPHNGFSVSYDRTYLTLSRPKPFSTAVSAFSPRGSTYQWGNHFKLGYTNEVGNGWNVDYNKTSGSYYTGASGTPTPRITTTSMYSVALNRLYRTDLSRGGYIEPYGGVRFLNITDQANSTGTLTRLDIGPDGLPGTGDDVTQNIVSRVLQEGANNAVGGQLGMKYFNSYGRWTISSDFGLSGLYNSQTAKVSTQPGFPAGPTLPATTAAEAFGNQNTFVPVAQLGLNTTYGVTRDISLRLGGEFMWAWNGINRANPSNVFAGNPNGFVTTVSQAMTAAGFSFGLEWRR